MDDYYPILPSSLLSVDEEGVTDALSRNFGDFSIKTGVVVKTYEIDDPNGDSAINENPSVVYDVKAISQEGEMGTNSVIYKKCMCVDFFGGSISDFFEQKLRSPTKDPRKEQNFEDANGSTVLVLCLNGNQDKAIIIGFLRNKKRKTTLTKEAGHHMEGEFNGVNWQVNKDGELTVTFKSASDNEGKYQDEEAGGSFLKIDKTGSIDINNDKTENIKIDKSANTIDINAEKDISLTTKANVKITAEENLEAQLKKDLILMAEGKATIEVKEKVNFKTDSDVVAKMKNLQAEVQNAVQLKLQTANILAQQLILNSTTGVQVTSQQMIMQSPLILLGPQPQPAVMIKTKYVGVGNLGVPVVSSPVGPFSASVFVSE